MLALLTGQDVVTVRCLITYSFCILQALETGQWWTPGDETQSAMSVTAVSKLHDIMLKQIKFYLIGVI